MKIKTEQNEVNVPMGLIEAARLKFLDGRTLHFSRHGATLRLTREGDCSYWKVGVARAFPLTEPGAVFSIRDGANEEIGILLDPSELSQSSRTVLEEELARRYLVPVVRSIRSARERFGTVDWEVMTDRGVCRFTTRNLGEHVQRVSPGRILLSDVDGNRYDIRNVDQLDTASLHFLFRHI